MIPRRVTKKIKRAHDLETHVSEIKVAGVGLVEIRDYIPSEGTYGRGVTLSNNHTQALIEGLQKVKKVKGA